tara:strand:+ start:1545 stop:1883 length:339 start_codon:yes stop_codon:yes gene_type:complete
MPQGTNEVEPNQSEDTSNFWDGVEAEQANQTMSIVECPHCSRRLRIPETYSGSLTCPGCVKSFATKNGYRLNKQGVVVKRKSKDNVGIMDLIILEMGVYLVVGFFVLLFALV